MTLNFKNLLQTELSKPDDMLKQHNTKKVADLEIENVRLKKVIDETTLKYHKLEKAGEDQERVLKEQSRLMKALNVRKNYFLCEGILFLCNEFVQSEILH